MRFNKWCYEWLERYKKRFLKESTYEKHTVTLASVFTVEKSLIS